MTQPVDPRFNQTPPADFQAPQYGPPVPPPGDYGYYQSPAPPPQIIIQQTQAQTQVQTGRQNRWSGFTAWYMWCLILGVFTCGVTWLLIPIVAFVHLMTILITQVSGLTDGKLELTKPVKIGLAGAGIFVILCLIAIGAVA